MWKILLLVFVGWSTSPHENSPSSCEYDSSKLCCSWEYEEAGCYDYFTVEESWCIDAITFEWDLYPNDDLTWHDRYIQDHCSNCPDCCITITEGDEDEDPGDE